MPQTPVTLHVVTYHRGGVPPGWYDDATGSGAMRWWDGQRWTEHRGPGPQRAAPYQRSVPIPGGGHPPLVRAGYQTASPLARRGTSRRVLQFTLVVVVVLIGGFVLLQVFSGGGTKSEWYQQGYDEGKDTALAFVATGSSPEAACDLALMDEIGFDNSTFNRRVKDLKRGCLQAVKDLDDGYRVPTLP
jgi:hypothetical protein